MAPRGGEHARNVRGEMLPVAVHRDDRIETELARLAETIAQTLALAQRCLVADQRDRKVGDALARRVGGTVVDHDHVRADRQHRFDHAADRALFVERGNHDRDAMRIGRAHGVTSTMSAGAGTGGNQDVHAALFRQCEQKRKCLRRGRIAGERGEGFGHGVQVVRRRRVAQLQLRERTLGALAPSTNAAANGEVLRATSASGPREAMSYATSSTGAPSACTWSAASSSPAANVAARGADRGRGGVAVRRDGPVAGRRVVHGIVEADRRELARIRGERLAHRVGNREVAVRRCEHAGQRRGIAPGHRAGLSRGFAGDQHRLRRAASFGGRQRRRRSALRRPRHRKARRRTRARPPASPQCPAPRGRCLRSRR